MSFLIAFDFDGVICDSMHVHMRAYQGVFKLFNKTWPLSTKKLWREQYDGRWERNFTYNGLTEDELPIALKHYYDFIDYTDADLFPGVTDLLSMLSKKSTLVITSSTKKEVVEKFLEKKEIRKYFQSLHCCNLTSDKSKLLKEACQKHGFTHRNAVMIGDTKGDIDAAKANNIPIITVSYGWCSKERLFAYMPDQIADSPEEVAEVLFE